MRIKDKGMELILYIMEFFRRAAQLSWTSSLKLSLVTKVNSAICNAAPNDSGFGSQVCFRLSLVDETKADEEYCEKC